MVRKTTEWDGRRDPFPVLIATAEALGAKKRLFAMKPPAVEVRLDHLREIPLPDLALFMIDARQRGISLLLTARRERDGGRWKAKDEVARRRSLLAWAPLADAVDVELDLGSGLETLLKKLSANPMRVPALILSIHRMKEMLPARNLDALARKAARLAGSYKGSARLKIALMARTREDADFLEAWASKKKNIPATVIAMGEPGRETRWRIPLLTGGPAYAPFGKPVAPGQLAWPELVRALKRQRVSRRAPRPPSR